MDPKSKAVQKGSESHAKQPARPGTEQVRSGTSMERSESEKIQAPKVGAQQKQKQGQVKSGKK
jgi:hypothetical protein